MGPLWRWPGCGCALNSLNSLNSKSPGDPSAQIRAIIRQTSYVVLGARLGTIKESMLRINPSASSPCYYYHFFAYPNHFTTTSSIAAYQFFDSVAALAFVCLFVCFFLLVFFFSFILPFPAIG